MPTINETIHPPGGYQFSEHDRTVFRSTKLAMLVEAVTYYRTKNGFPLGNPAEEIAVQMCKRYPVVCRPSGPTRAVSTHPPDPPQANRSLVLQWMNRKRKQKLSDGSLPLRNDAEAARRAGICRTCPQKTILSNGCSVCSDAVKIIRANILGRTSIAEDIGACTPLNCDLAVAIHLDDPAVENPALPAHCWRKVGV